MSAAKRAKRIIAAVSLLLVTSSNTDGCYRPLAPVFPGQTFSHIYLTWAQPDTARTMSVRLFRSDTPNVVRIRYGEQGSGTTRDRLASLRTIPGVVGASVAHVELVDLQPNTVYTFDVLVDSMVIESRTFRTLPADDTPIRLVNGGDQGTGPAFVELCRLAASFDPHAAIVGGDIAYADGQSSNYERWLQWVATWEETMVTSEGHHIPVVVAIGNHETNRLPRDFPELRAPYFMPLFGQAQSKTHFLRTFGSHTTLVILDTDHVASHRSQVTWLDAALRTYATTNLLAAYHVPLYPAHRNFNGPNSQAGRQHWQPVFDMHELDLAMEHHDHALKRTYPLLTNETVDPRGTIYIGDGAWGREARVARTEREYLEAASATQHFWVLDVGPNGIEATAIDIDGSAVDSVTIPAD